MHAGGPTEERERRGRGEGEVNASRQTLSLQRMEKGGDQAHAVVHVPCVARHWQLQKGDAKERGRNGKGAEEDHSDTRKRAVCYRDALKRRSCKRRPMAQRAEASARRVEGREQSERWGEARDKHTHSLSLSLSLNLNRGGLT